MDYDKKIKIIKDEIDTKIKMLEIVRENNVYKKKVIFTLISLILLGLISLVVIYNNSK